MKLSTRQQKVAKVALPTSIGLLVLWTVRRKLLNGLQTLIAKGRKTHNRGGLLENYAPTDKEVHVTELKVEGKLPEWLEGAYLRNGSNPHFPVYASYHWFEGDGMVHATRIKGGKVSYCNRWVETSRLQQEKKVGKAIFAKFGDQEGVRGVFVALLEILKAKLRVIDMSRGNGTANTSIVAHAGRIMALHEGDLPYHLRLLCDGLLETAGRLGVRGWGSQPFTAHPKLDSATGVLHFLGYNIDKKPWLQVGAMDEAGRMARPPLTVDVPYPAMMHDMALTDRFVVLFHLPLCFEPEAMIKHNSLPLVFKEDRPARIGLLAKDPYATTVRWFELPAFMAFHVANAWEEEDGSVVKVHLCAMPRFNMAAREADPESFARMCELTLDLRSGAATRRWESTARGDFPVVHPALQGRPSRWAYIATSNVDDPRGRIGGIAKIDLWQARSAPAGQDLDATTAVISYPTGVTGGEAYFVPRPGQGVAEDDGVLVVYTYDEPADASHFCVYDAATMSPQPLARVRLPQRVPYGFHGSWVTEAQLRQQPGFVPASAAAAPAPAAV